MAGGERWRRPWSTRILATVIVALTLWNRVASASSSSSESKILYPMIPSLPRSFNATGFKVNYPKTNHIIPRRLAEPTGINRVLIVRVSTNEGSETTSSVEEIENTLYDGSPTVKSQYNQCSGGALTIENGGSVEITLPYSIQGIETDKDQEFLEDIRLAAQEQAGAPVPDSFDHVLYCLPQGSSVAGDFGWVGFGDLDGPNSYYNDGKCAQHLSVMHELGHNCKYKRKLGGSRVVHGTFAHSPFFHSWIGSLLRFDGCRLLGRRVRRSDLCYGH